MISIEDCADSTIKISTDAVLNDDTVGKLKDIIQYIYDIREKQWITIQATEVANDDDFDDSDD